MVNVLERERIAATLPEASSTTSTTSASASCARAAAPQTRSTLELTSRAAAAMGVREALVDPEFPLVVADRLRADGIELTADPEAFEARRRAKSTASSTASAAPSGRRRRGWRPRPSCCAGRAPTAMRSCSTASR